MNKKERILRKFIREEIRNVISEISENEVDDQLQDVMDRLNIGYGKYQYRIDTQEKMVKIKVADDATNERDLERALQRSNMFKKIEMKKDLRGFFVAKGYY